MAISDDQNRQGQGGAGSAENRGNERSEQQATLTKTDPGKRQEIADQAGLEANDIIDVQDTGALSGRDDAGGGSGDLLEKTSSKEPTPKY